MMDFRIKNTTKQPIEVVTGHVIKPGGSIEVEAQAFDRLKNHNYFKMKVRREELTWERINPVSNEPLTRSAVAKMNRGDLVGILVNKGYKAEELKGLNVEDTEEHDGLRTLVAFEIFGADDAAG